MRDVVGPGKVLGQRCRADRHAEVRIDPPPELGVTPVGARLRRRDENKCRVILDEALDQLQTVIALAPADALAPDASGGDAKRQRLAPGALARLQDIPHRRGFVRMQLIDNRTVNIQAVEKVGVAGETLNLLPIVGQ